ncbi:hypothetical protein SARC_14111 [Sphaeroforma arctica JP610]|uniref:Uncharacterized protein n=1 Tax=Sphaeroforma arctica JP610 TaxID=667725 RepID=A0A0L0F9D3_9EUKA|nr:hypothetical protein SARC_14111 [Sphaeroforma arctica JP610]KNC73330.1 hypothetical protein SARC_14111 [Sphaeroforma arctica JP610]|eukprot:XP_014147232.1 hypothetical protein SARC_14111 [Sphaeroforma arctica JP610]
MKIQSPIVKRREKKLARRKAEFEEIEERTIEGDGDNAVPIPEDSFTKNMRECGGLIQNNPKSEQVIIRYDALPPQQCLSLLRDSFRPLAPKVIEDETISEQEVKMTCNGSE